MTALEFLNKTYNPEEFHTRPHAVCEDGFTISIQGGTWHHYSRPRPAFGGSAINEYETLELGFPSAPDPIIFPWAEDESEPTQTVYGYVPIEVVEMLVKDHGGIMGVKA